MTVSDETYFLYGSEVILRTWQLHPSNQRPQLVGQWHSCKLIQRLTTWHEVCHRTCLDPGDAVRE